MKLEIEQKKLYKVLKGVKSTIGSENNEEVVLDLNDERIITTCRSESDVLMFSSYIGKESMKAYDAGDVGEIGVNVDDLSSVVSKSSDPIRIETMQTKGGINKLKVDNSDIVLETPMIDPEYITGKIEDVPEVGWNNVLVGDISFLDDFLSDADGIVDASAFVVDVRDDYVGLYAEKDDTNIKKRISSDSFEEVDTTSDDAVTMLSVEWGNSMKFLADSGRIEMKDNAPFKVVFDIADDVIGSYILAPRLPQDGQSIPKPDSYE